MTKPSKNAEPNKDDNLNLFEDLSKLSANQDFDTVSAEIDYTHIPMRKPSKSEFFRVSPELELREKFFFLDYRAPGTLALDKYLIPPGLAKEVGDVPGIRLHLVVAAVSRPDNSPWLWPLRLPNANRAGLDTWALSALEVLKQAEKRWLRCESKMELSAYIAYLAKGEWPEPRFPDLTLADMLRKAIPEDRIISSSSHPIIRQLRGEL